jgi:hypothetical protein
MPRKMATRVKPLLIFASLLEEPPSCTSILRKPQKHGINLSHLRFRRYVMPDSSLAGGSTMRFGAILDLPLVLTLTP